MNAPFITPRAAEAWRAANPTPSRPQLAAFLAAEPRPLPTQTHLSPAVVKLALYLLGAVALGIVGAICH